MKKLLAVCTLSLSFLSVSAMAETFHGVVSDAMCAKNDVAKAGTPGHADCAKKCIGMGSPAVRAGPSKGHGFSRAKPASSEGAIHSAEGGSEAQRAQRLNCLPQSRH